MCYLSMILAGIMGNVTCLYLQGFVSCFCVEFVDSELKCFLGPYLKCSYIARVEARCCYTIGNGDLVCECKVSCSAICVTGRETALEVSYSSTWGPAIAHLSSPLWLRTQRKKLM